MWLEVKAVLSITGFFMQCLAMGLFLGFPGVVGGNIIVFVFALGFGLYLFSDILLGIKIAGTNANYLFDVMPMGYEVGFIESLTKRFDLVKAKITAEGKREFKYNGQDASVHVSGKNIIHTINGNHGFIAQEGYDQDIDLVTCKAMELFEGDDIKEIYKNTVERRKDNGGETVGGPTKEDNAAAGATV